MERGNVAAVASQKQGRVHLKDLVAQQREQKKKTHHTQGKRRKRTNVGKKRKKEKGKE